MTPKSGALTKVYWLDPRYCFPWSCTANDVIIHHIFCVNGNQQYIEKSSLSIHVPLHMPPQFVKPWVLHCVRPWKEMSLSTPLATHEFTPVKHNEFRHLENSALNVCIIKNCVPKNLMSFFSFPCQPYCQQWTLDPRRNINIISRTSPKACSLPTHQRLVFYLLMKYSKKSIPLTVSGWRTQNMLLVRRQMHCMRESLSFSSYEDTVYMKN